VAADTGVAVEVIGDELTLPRSLQYHQIAGSSPGDNKPAPEDFLP
jgi:hypothetical protein